MKNKKRVLVIGLGDLGSRIAQMIAERGLCAELKLASRSEAAQQWASLLSLGTDCKVSSEKTDGLDLEKVSKLLAGFQPDLVLQCATLFSPWSFLECGTPPAMGVLSAGFALQASAQLPVAMNVMRARQKSGLSCSVINCSFPDLVNPLLARLGLAPTAGIGNVAMIARHLERTRPDRNRSKLRVVAHHAHVAPALSGRKPEATLPLPLAYEGDQKLGEDDVYIQPGIEPGRHFNYLTACTAIPLITSLLDHEVVLETHAPGILGLPGGYPTKIERGAIQLDLPADISLNKAVEFNNLSARADGIERIEDDGTLIYTEHAKALAALWCAELAQPLKPANLATRFATLQSFYKDSCQPKKN
jgi:hypothetical protein